MKEYPTKKAYKNADFILIETSLLFVAVGSAGRCLLCQLLDQCLQNSYNIESKEMAKKVPIKPPKVLTCHHL